MNVVVWQNVSRYIITDGCISHTVEKLVSLWDGRRQKNQCNSIYFMGVNGQSAGAGGTAHKHCSNRWECCTRPAGLFSNGQKSSRRGQEWD